MNTPAYIGIDLGGTNIRAARFAVNSHVPEAKTKIPTQAARGREVVLDRLEQAVREVAPAGLEGVAAVGLALPGLTDPHTEMVLTLPNIPGLENLALAGLMRERLGGVPVLLGNDANLAALGEWRFGAGRGHPDLLYLTISTGIGGAVIAGGRLLLGARGLATEVGHILAVPDGPLCGCGHRGHLEAVASGTAIGRTARERLQAGQGADSRVRELVKGDLTQVTAVIISQAARAGDEFALSCFAQAGWYIGRSLASLLHLFNPSIVIFGGGVSLEGDILLDPVRAALREYSLGEVYWRDCPLVLAELGDDAGLVGAGALAMAGKVEGGQGA